MERLFDHVIGIVCAILGIALLSAAFVHLRAPVLIAEPGVAMPMYGEMPATPAPIFRGVAAMRKKLSSGEKLVAARIGRSLVARVMPAPIQPSIWKATATAASPRVRLRSQSVLRGASPERVRLALPAFVLGPVTLRLPRSAQSRISSARLLHRKKHSSRAAPIHARASVTVVADPDATPEPPIGYDPGSALVSTLGDLPEPPVIVPADLPTLHLRKHR